jgi:hypothetical protein
LRLLVRVFGLAGSVLVAAALSCGSGVYHGGSTPFEGGVAEGSSLTEGGGTEGGAGPGLGIGKACSDTSECRSGLVCSSAKSCEPSHAVASGGACVLDDSCKTGLTCIDGHCAPGGTGVAGSGCQTDADCSGGLRCDIVGLGAECQPEGMGDIGATCTTSSDCYGGLACLTGKCAAPPPGVPPTFGTPWAGTPCTDITGPVTAYFRVPRGTDDGDFYRLPFPNDIRLVGGQPNVATHPTPGPGVLGYDVVARYLQAIDSDADGWGAYGTVFFRFSGELSNSIATDSSVQVVDLTTGQGLGWGLVYSEDRNNYICDNWVGVRQPQGAAFTPGHTYAVYLPTTITAMGGATIAVSSDFTAVMGATQPGDATLAAAWTAYAPFRAYLSGQAIAVSSVLTAAVFTVGHPPATLTALASGVASAPVPTASQWTLCNAGVTSPCPQNSGTRGCTTADPSFAELHALVSLPIFQNGTEPYLDPSDGGNITVSGGVATLVRSEQVCMSLSVPNGTPPAGGYPTIVYAHGTDGSFRDQVILGIAHDFAVGVDDGTGTLVQAALLGIDQVETGTRRGSSTESPDDLFFNFGNPSAALGNPQQGGADQLSLLRFVPTVSFAAATSPTMAAFSLSGAPVAFWGHSQGATEGALGLPYSGYAGAVLSGEGASLTDALLTKTNPVDVAAAVPIALEDIGPDGTLPGGTFHPVLSLLQMYIDPADPVNFGGLIAANPPGGVLAHHVFQPYGQLDTYAPPVTEATYALAAQLGLVAHDTTVTTPDPIGDLTEIPSPASGNLTVGGKPITALVREYAPMAGQDGHFVAFNDPTARADVERFLAQVLEGKVPQVGP